jgi:hypothetical protein
MGRLTNKTRVITNERPIHAGKLLIFCEGATEHNYLEYLNQYLKNNVKARYSELVLEQIETIDTKGNAQNVFNYAENFLNTDDNARKYSLYEKHLVFDCDAPKDIQSVIEQMKNSVHDYVLDYSCLLFETWLVMHYMHLAVTDDVKKGKILSRIREYLGVKKYTSKVKASRGTIASILGNEGNIKIRQAIDNAKELQKYWSDHNYEYYNNVKIMNPSTSIHELVEVLLDEIEDVCK